jgi:hypothetical protein
MPYVNVTDSLAVVERPVVGAIIRVKAASPRIVHVAEYIEAIVPRTRKVLTVALEDSGELAVGVLATSAA